MATEAEAEVKNTPADGENLLKEASSSEPLVQLRVMDINNVRTKDVFIDPASTIADLKREVQNVFDDRPAPEKQRLIFRGKNCENTERIGHVLRGLDLTVPQKMTLLLRLEDSKVEQPAFPWDPPVTTRVGKQPPVLEKTFWTNVSRARQNVLMPIQDGGIKFTRVSKGLVEVNPWPFKLEPLQVAQLRRQYQHALRESREALAMQRGQYEFLTGRPAASNWPQGNAVEPQLSRRLPHWQPSAAMESEVATTEATRALGGNMPGPTAGAAVRDITGPLSEGLIPAAGHDENVGEGRFNRVDPAPRRPDFRREFQVFLKMFLQFFGVVVVFGIDANGWVLFLLALVGFVAVLVKTGIFEAILGGSLWKSLCSAATVISEGGGLVTDVMYFWSAFFLSLFPTWKPQRSPEVIAAEAAAREASRAAEAAVQEAVRAAAVAQGVRVAEATVQEATRVSEAATQESESKAEEDSEAAGPAPSEAD